MKKLRYVLVDVFTTKPFGGNPLAVFVNGRGVSTETMQALAKELNLSETTFVLPPEDPANHYRVRIFTPAAELPMAGHPTVGTSYVLAKERMIEWEGDQTTIRLEEKVGIIPVKLEFENGIPQLIQMQQPLPTFGPVFENSRAIAEILGLEPDAIDTKWPLDVVSCGVPFLFVPLKNLKALESISFRRDAWEKHLANFAAPHILAFTPTGRNGEVYQGRSRVFAPALGIPEDPATGGASGPLGCYMVRYGLVEIKDKVKILSEQGVEMGRPSLLEIEIEVANHQISGVYVGGNCYPMGEGIFEVDD